MYISVELSDSAGEGSLACCGPRGGKGTDLTERLSDSAGEGSLACCGPRGGQRDGPDRATELDCCAADIGTTLNQLYFNKTELV